MNRNDIRPIAIGIAAALGAFGAIYVWLEHDPWEAIAGHIARRQLTPEERAELDRMTAEQQERSRQYRALTEAEDSKRAELDAKVAAGFNPDLLSRPDPVASPRELDLAELVAEIEHAEHACRRTQYGGLVYPHREALHLEFTRRNDWRTRMTASRPDVLRLDIAAERVRAARNLPYSYQSPPAPAEDYDYGSFPGYPGFVGPEPVDYGVEIGE